MNDAHERYARMTQESFEVRWIHSLIAGSAKDNHRFALDRRGAEALMRERGWDPAEVTARAEQYAQGIIEVPRPFKEVQARPVKGKRRLGFGIGSDPAKSWEDAVNAWTPLRRRTEAAKPATPEQRSWWGQECQRRMRGEPARPRPWAPDHPDGYGREGSISARPRLDRQHVVHGLVAESLFSAPTLSEAAREDGEPEWAD